MTSKKAITGKKSASGDAVEAKQGLLEENRLLREKIAAVEAELQAGKVREQTLAAAIKLGFWEWDEINNRPSYLSAEYASILGFSQEKLYEIYQCEDDLYDFVHPDDLEQYKYHVNLLAREKNEDGLAHVFDYRIIRPDGVIRHVREMEIGIREIDGQLVQSYGAVQDTTEYHELLIASQDSEEKYSSLFSQMPLGVLEQDYSYIKQRIDELRSQGVVNIKEYLEANEELLKDMVDGSFITAVNDALLELYRTDSLEDFRADDADTDSWWSDEWVKFYASEIDGLLSPANIHMAELQEERFDGTFFETRLITKVLGSCRDTWDRVITMHDDVTERRQNELALIEAKEAAELASRAKSDFLATMSHEIRTPMNGVLGMTELLMGSDLDARALRLASTAYRSAESLLEIINDILDFSKIEAEKMELAEADFDLREMLEDALEMIAGQAHRKGLECIANLPPDLPQMVRGDAVRLRQVLVNLLGNAVKFTERGEIGLMVKAAGRSVDSFDMVFEVSDTGPGVPLDQQATIFEAFSQIDSSASRHYDGTGLGLAISGRLIELMQGRIELESAPGNGALFRISIPLAVAENDITRPQAPTDLAGQRVLIVDDHAIDREILHNQVASWGMRDDSVESGIKAIGHIRAAQAENDPYQLVLLDWHMPELDGLELARMLSEDTAIDTPQLVLLSSTGFDTRSTIAQQASITRYLQKPVRQQLLLDCLREIIGAKRSTGVDATKQESQFKGEILLAEDNLVNQEVAIGMLLALGCDADLAENGVVAVSAARDKRYDLILMDCHMPVMDGFAASKQIREYENQQGLARTPIVALTADIKKGIEDECVDAGMDGYLSKPFSQNKLAGLLDQWLISQEAGAKSTAEVTNRQEKILDTEVLLELRTLSKTTGRDIIGKSIQFFLKQTPEDVAGLRRAATALDLEGLQKTAHSLKSSSANLGAMKFSRLCGQLEDAAREQRGEGASALLLSIETLLPGVLLELGREMKPGSESDFDNAEATRTAPDTAASGIKTA